jgi:hypothetical protein
MSLEPLFFLTQLPPQRVNSTQLPGEFSFPVLILSDFVWSHINEFDIETWYCEGNCFDSDFII